MDSKEESKYLKSDTEVSDYTDYTNWGENYDDEYEYQGDEEEEYDKQAEEEEEEEEEEEADMLTDYMTQFEAKRVKELAAKAKAKKEKILLLIGVKKEKDDDASEETLITPEDEITLSPKSSSESSIHPCLRNIEISDSRLKLSNLYTSYPIPEDPGIIPAFWMIFERPRIYPDNGVQKFFDIVQKSGMKPIQSMREMLLTDKINLRYYGIDSQVVRAICESLENNTSVEIIDLKDNWLTKDACYHLGQLLMKNTIVHSLLLSGCRIGAEGVAKLHEGISRSTALTSLDLSGCDIRSDGFASIATAVCNNQVLEKLVLRNNSLDESCAVDLQYLLTESETLKELDLSWNSLYSTTTWKILSKGLEKNKMLTDLNLSWNGLGNECISYLSKLLSRSLILQKLDLSGNLFDENNANSIAKALSKNKILQELHLGDNPLTASGALALISAITPQKSPGSNLRILNLTNVWTKKDVLPELEAIENGKPWLNIKLGGILSNYEIVGPNIKLILLKRANFEAMKPKKKKLRRNFGHFVLSLSDNPVSRAKFVELVKGFRLRLSESLINEIMNAFAGPKRTVDQALLKSFYLEQYPNTKPPPQKSTKLRKRESKEKRELTKRTKKGKQGLKIK